MKRISKIFSDHGESYFRNIEQDLVLSLLDKKNCVISLGGGSILSYLTRKALFIIADTKTLNSEKGQIQTKAKSIKHI